MSVLREPISFPLWESRHSLNNFKMEIEKRKGYMSVYSLCNAIILIYLFFIIPQAHPNT